VHALPPEAVERLSRTVGDPKTCANQQGWSVALNLNALRCAGL